MVSTIGEGTAEQEAIRTLTAQCWHVLRINVASLSCCAHVMFNQHGCNVLVAPIRSILKLATCN